MKTVDLNINLPLSFNQIVELIKQLPFKEKMKLSALLEKEIKDYPVKEKEEIITHLASEAVLSWDWLSPEEDEAWKDL